MPDVSGEPVAAITALDLHSPTELERAEEIIGAAARAIAHEPSLRFRGHQLHVGPRLAPARAPHVRPLPEHLTVDDLRGGADGIALRIRHSRADIYAAHRPEGALADLIYEILEQFRVEALAPESTKGVRRNLKHRFDAWSDECVTTGLIENDIGLLLFSTVHVCRSRILAVAIEERINDYTESTRFGIYEVMGKHLLALRSTISDQATFAPHAAAIAEAISELAASQMDESVSQSKQTTMLAMLAMPEFDGIEEGGQAAGGSGPSRLGDGNEYCVYTERYDHVMPVTDLVLPHALTAARTELDALTAENRPLGSALRRSIAQLFPEPDMSTWDAEQEEGYLDPRLLVGVVTGTNDGRIYRKQAPEFRPQGAVSVLVDCSGSMKSVIKEVTTFVDLLVRALDRADIATEVLGYTTGAWSGGRPYREWLGQGRPPHPGRLNEVNHIIFKDASTSWRRARGALAGMMWTPMFREGLDGEALEWAYRRLLTVDAPRRHLLMICDGSPMDGATTLANGDRYLDRHLAEVISMIDDEGIVSLAGLGIGHDLSAYMSRSRIVEPTQILDRTTAGAVMSFLRA